MAATAARARMSDELILKSKAQVPRRQFLVCRGCCPILGCSNNFLAAVTPGPDPWRWLDLAAKSARTLQWRARTLETRPDGERHGLFPESHISSAWSLS